MPPEPTYFAELAEQIGRIKESIESIPEIARKVDRVCIIVEGVDGDNGMKKAVSEIQKDVAEIKTYRSNEDAVAASKETFWTPWKTMLFSILGSLIVLLVTLALTGRLSNG